VWLRLRDHLGADRSEFLDELLEAGPLTAALLGARPTDTDGWPTGVPRPPGSLRPAAGRSTAARAGTWASWTRLSARVLLAYLNQLRDTVVRVSEGLRDAQQLDACVAASGRRTAFSAGPPDRHGLGEGSRLQAPQARQTPQPGMCSAPRCGEPRPGRRDDQRGRSPSGRPDLNRGSLVPQPSRGGSRW
jgi:hypothetical protein